MKYVTVLFCIVLTGCVTSDHKTEIVADNPFGQAAPVAMQSSTSYASPSLAAAARVDQIGRRLVAANKQTGLQPLFRTIGAPQSAIFHRGTTELVMTEGLVKQCTTDGQLAAMLCIEMGKMVSDREALATPSAGGRPMLPPMEVAVGNDAAGSMGTADQMHQAEVAKFDQEHPRQPRPLAPPDPQMLAKAYLTKAGFAATDLDAVAPILRAAQENNTSAKQIVPPPPAP